MAPEIQVLLVRPAFLARLVQEVLPALREALDFLERREQLDSWDPVDLKAVLEQQGFVDFREMLDQREPLALLAHKDRLEQQVINLLCIFFVSLCYCFAVMFSLRFCYNVGTSCNKQFRYFVHGIKVNCFIC